MHKDHEEDLRRSGLLDATFTLMGVASVPPLDILKLSPMLGSVESVLEFPYPNVEGFSRYKLFPPVGDMKYFQKSDTGSHLYILPSVKDVLSNPNVDLWFVEGERAGEKWTGTLGAKSVNKVYATLNKVYKFARRYGVKVNPMLDVERKRDSVSLEELEKRAAEGADMGEESKDSTETLWAIGGDEVLSSVELSKLIEASTPGLEKVKHMVAVFTGVRHGELNGLRWATVDLKKGRIFINRSLTELKGGAILEKVETTMPAVIPWVCLL